MSGLFEIFFAPGKVFDRVRDSRAWAVPFIACVLLFALVFAYMYQVIGAENITRRSLNESKFAAQMTDEQKEQAAAASATTAAKIRTPILASVGYGVLLVVFAALFMAIAGASGGPIRFTQALGTVSYSSWPIAVVRTLLSVIVVMMAVDKTSLDPQHLLAFNGGAFLDKTTTAKPLFALASAFDLLLFAEMVLAAYGLARVARIGFSKAFIGTVLIWIVFTALAMGISLVF